MSVVVGVDGGQSQIRMRVSGEEQTDATPGVSHVEADTVGSVVDAVAKLWGNRSTPVERLVAGLTTIPATEAERQDLAVRLARATGADEVWVCGDQVTSHAGAFTGRSGVSLSVGTGVACLAVDELTGTHRTFDGAGYLVGDEGGAFWIGRRGIRAALAAHEGRGPETSLMDAVEAELGPLDSVAVRLHATARAVDSIAHIAPTVLAQAAAGDPVANEIVSDAVARLMGTVTAALSFLSPESPGAVALDGRLLLDDNPLRTLFLSEMQRAHPSVSVFKTPGSSLDGAMWLARHGGIDGYGDLITTCRMEAAEDERSQMPSAGRRYLSGAIDVLEQIATHEWPAIRAAAATIADTVAAGGLVHVFGTGHSHMLAEEMFYRAGGLAAVNPVLVESLMLHAGAEESTRLERLPGTGASIFPDVPIKEGDTLIVASNSGGNAACGEMARLAADAGATIVAIVSARHAESSGPTDDLSRLTLVADILIDNHGTIGDASVAIDGLSRKVAPTSTVAGAAIVNAIVAETVEILVERGDPVEFFSSSNIDGGDKVNHALVARYREVVKAL